jgi:TRAP-type C4-dicarboxylate transport system permease small subunit
MLGCCLLLAHGTWKQVVLAMDDRAPVSGVPMGVVFSALLVCALGISLLLLQSLWRQLSCTALPPEGASASLRRLCGG